MRLIATLIMIENLMMDEGPLEEEDDIMIEVEGHQIEEMINGEVILEEKDPLMMEDPLTMVNCLMMEDPLMVEDPQMMEDPLEMEDIQDDLEDDDHQVQEDLLDPYNLL